MIGYAMCGSFCTLQTSFDILEKLCASYDVVPIMSYMTYGTDTRFGEAKEFVYRAEALCGHRVIHTVEDAEPLGPACPLEALLICPCTGNTLAKLARGITDTPVCMAAKAHLRSDRPLIIALASNDALSANLGNIATLLGRKQVYLVPMKQDDCVNKPRSVVADFSKTYDAALNALKNRQIQPIYI